MDEPTTHLDIHTVESLMLALERYEGTLVFISHDVHFIRQLATKVLHVSAGQVTPYVGGMNIFWRKPERRAIRARPSPRAEKGRFRPGAGSGKSATPAPEPNAGDISRRRRGAGVFNLNQPPKFTG
jgi:ATPase subunit of ABC transporter with duplicated ATPase domains